MVLGKTSEYECLCQFSLQSIKLILGHLTQNFKYEPHGGTRDKVMGSKWDISPQNP